MQRIVTALMIALTVYLMLPRLSVAAPGEEVLRHAPVPVDPPYQGEVRLLRRDGTPVVQTLLYSKVMNRVVAAIQKKELKAWPQGKEGAEESRRYSEELVQAYETVRERAKERQRSGDKDRYLQLAIEFVLEGERAYVALYAPTLTREDDRLALHKKELLKKLPLSRSYVRKNMQLILEDNFQVEPGEASQLLKQAAGD